MRTLLFGGTDLTAAVADLLLDLEMPPCGVVYVERSFSISYRRDGVRNSRYADMGAWAAARGIPALAYTGMDAVEAFMAETKPDVGLVAGWYHMIPRRIRAALPKGCLGIHASLLPKLRGGAPLNWAIITGATETGVSLFEMADGVDDGLLYGQKAIRIGARTCIGELVDLSTAAILAVLRDALPRIADGTAEPWPQTGIPSYGMQRSPEDGLIDWTMPCAAIDRLIRAVANPYPGAYTHLGDVPVTIWRAEPLAIPAQVHGAPGQIVRLPAESEHPLIITGDGLLAVLEAEDADGADLMPTLRAANNQRFISG